MLGAVTEVLAGREIEGWLVGGSVRDRELGRSSPDLDIAVAGDPIAVAKEIASALGAPWFSLSDRHPTYRILGPEGYVDVAAVRGDGIRADLELRDFTVNAMAVPLGGDGLIDPFGGLDHLRQKRLVAVSDRVFKEDPLRLMRAVRFCHVLGFEFDQALSAMVRREAGRLSQAAAERVAAEMALTLGAGRSAEAVRTWEDMGLLPVVLPDLSTGARSSDASAVLTRLDEFLNDPGAWFPRSQALLHERAGRPVDGATTWAVALRLAGLMHRLTGIEAEVAGRRLKLSGAVVSLVSTVCRCLAVERMEKVDTGSRRAEVLFLWDASPWEPETVILAAAAAGASAAAPAGAGPGRAGRRRGLGWARELMDLWAVRATHGSPVPPIDGDVLMRAFGLESGPIVGSALREVRLAWESGEIGTPEEALAVARQALEES